MPTPDNSMDSMHTGAMTPVQRSEDWSALSKIALASIGSQGTMGGLLVAGFVSKRCLKDFITNSSYKIAGFEEIKNKSRYTNILLLRSFSLLKFSLLKLQNSCANQRKYFSRN